jgi:hypothetical protein
MRALAFVLLLSGCTDVLEEGEQVCKLGEVLHDGECVPPSPDGKFDLPNGAIVDRPYDGQGYAKVVEFFRAKMFDLNADPTMLDAGWVTPVKSAALNRFGTPILLGSYGYIHTALDVMRPTVMDPIDVVSPIDGTAFMFDWYGNVGWHGNPYAGVVGIWDPKSKLIFQLMHVEPSMELIAAGQNSIQVTKGQKIGKLALPPISGANAELYRHTHVDIVDGRDPMKMRALDPSRYLAYEDHAAPAFGELYVLDGQAKKHTTLQTGKLDIVVPAHDRDDHSGRNFEVNALSYSIAIDGEFVTSIPKCELDHLYERVTTENYSSGVLSLIDFGSAAAQVDNQWPSSDLGNVDRTFRYALTQLAVVEGRCTVKKDADGFIDVPASARELTVYITAWDPTNNSTTVMQTIKRAP